MEDDDGLWGVFRAAIWVVIVGGGFLCAMGLFILIVLLICG